MRSSRSTSTSRRPRRSTTCAGDSPAPGGPSPRPSTTGRRAYRSPTCRRSAAYWGDGYDWRATERGSTPARSSRPDRRARHPLSPRPLAGTRCPPARAHPRVAGLHRRVPRGDRTADRPRRPRRRRRGRLPRGVPVAARATASPTSRRPRAGTSRRIAEAWATLMARLGYERYGAQGGDWGSAVTTTLGRQRPRPLAGIHVNMVRSAPPGRRRRLTDASGRPSTTRGTPSSGAPATNQQSTRPQTLGYGLVDSPAGQAAWIVEKFWAWTDCDGHPRRRPQPRRAARQRDALLAHRRRVRRRRGSTGRASAGPQRDRCPVPTGCSIFPGEIRPTLAALGRAALHEPPLLERARPRRPLRRLRAARALRRRGALLLSIAPLAVRGAAGRALVGAAPPLFASDRDPEVGPAPENDIDTHPGSA